MEQQHAGMIQLPTLTSYKSMPECLSSDMGKQNARMFWQLYSDIVQQHAGMFQLPTQTSYKTMPESSDGVQQHARMQHAAIFQLAPLT